MHENPQLDFYLKHRRDIEEWSSIRTQAASALSMSLEAAYANLASGLEPHGPSQILDIYDGRAVWLPLSDVGPVRMMCWWAPGRLFDSGSPYCWPWLSLETPRKVGWTPYADLKTATQEAAAEHRLTVSGTEFIWKTRVDLPVDETDLDMYADRIMGRLSAAWRDLGPIVGKVMQEQSQGV